MSRPAALSPLLRRAGLGLAAPSLALWLAAGCSGNAPAILTPDQPMPTTAARELAFAFRTRGPDGAIPQAIAFHANLPMFTDAYVGKAAPAGTELVLEPAVPGALTVEGPSSLVFTPSEPLKPGTTYRARLVSVGGTPVPPWLKDWHAQEGEFTTPAFAFRRADVTRWDPARRTATVTLAFSGPVDPADVADHLRIEGALRGLPNRVEAGASANLVNVVYTGVDLTPLAGASVPIALQAGVALSGSPDVHAGSAEPTLTLAAPGPRANVAAVKLREGLDGFYIDVLCDDAAVAEKRWFWDRDDYEDYELSTRCMLDETSAQQRVHVSVDGADTPVSVSPSGTGFRVFGALPFGQATLRIDPDARTVDGSQFGVAVEEALTVPHRASAVAFTTQGRYLPRSAWTSLPIQHTNLPTVQLTVRHIPEQNVVFWMSGQEIADARTSDVVLNTLLPLPAPIDAKTTSWIDVRSLIPNAENGVYELLLNEADPQTEIDATDAPEVQDTGSRWNAGEYHPPARAAARILLTDMHLVAKVSAPDASHAWGTRVDAWSIDVHTNEAVSGADIRLVRPSGSVLASCVTDNDGHCGLALPANGVDDAEPMALIARHGKDYTYLKFDDLKLDVPGDTAGYTGPEAPYRASIWTERGVYRPGDTAHVAVLVRGDAHVAPSPAVPMSIRLQDPSGKELRRQVLTPNEAGLATWDVRFGDWATTGVYSVVAEVGGRTVGIESFNVEEFVPERLRVAASTPVADALSTAAAPVDVQADWLFGGPASSARVELECHIEAAEFAPPTAAGYRFGPLTGEDGARAKPIPLGVTNGTLDAAGHAQLRCPTAPGAATLSGPGALVARASVFEGDSGRTTVSEARTRVHPDRSYVGLRGPERADAGKPVHLDGMVVDWTGKPVPGTTHLTVTWMRLEEEVGWMWDEDSNDTVYRRTPRRVKESTVPVVATDGRFSLDVTPQADAAAWVAVASLGASRTELSVDSVNRRWWWSNWDTSVDQTPRPQLPQALAIGLPDVARVGASVTATATAPYAGRVLWTVEAESVISSHWETVEAGPIQHGFEVERFRPNVYVSALLVKDPHIESASAFMPDRAFGVANLRVEPAEFTLPLKLTAPTEVLPQAPLTVQIDAGPLKEPGFVTVAAVDAGILSLTKYADPDPARDIFARRALGVDSYETVGWTLLSQPGGAGRRTGGDGMAGLGRVQMVHPVALWSGVVPVPTSGKVSVTLPVPSYRGALRVMAVAATRSGIGHAAADVTVREPLTLTPSVPRFLNVGDAVKVPVQVTNVTSSPQDITVRLSLSDAGSPEQKAFAEAGTPDRAIVLTGADSGHLKLAPNASGTLVFQLAGRRTGAARVEIRASAGSLVSTDHYDVPVQLVEPEVTETVRIPLGGGATSLAAALDGWQPGTEQSTVWVTANPYAPAFARMKHLLHYPYGCVEQTVSSARPLLYARTLMQEAAPETLQGKGLDDAVNAGIDRVLSMQTPSGGFAYWPGGREPVLWGTAYAVHFLLDAQQAGYPVPGADVADAVKWLGAQIDASRHTDDERAYAHFVLARAGKPQMAAAQQLLDRLPATTREETTYALQAAIWLAGDHRHERALKHPGTSIRTARSRDWSFWSALRERAFQLATFRELFGADPAGQELADRVAGALSARGDDGAFTTQELAWALTGLGRSVGTEAAGAKATVRVGGREQAPSAAGSTTWLLSRPSLASGAVTVSGAAGQYAVVTTSGNRVSSPSLWGGSGLRVTRGYRDAAGAPIRAETLTLGQPVYIDIAVLNDTGTTLPNVAVADRVPAAWEIENPRLGRGALPEWVDADTLWETDNLNVRDDRIEVFGALPPGEWVHVVYMVRATFAGVFRAPDVHAEAMYDPELWARLPGQSVTVTAPWDAAAL